MSGVKRKQRVLYEHKSTHWNLMQNGSTYMRRCTCQSHVSTVVAQVREAQTNREDHQEERSEMVEHLSEEVPPQPRVWREVRER